ILHGASIVGTFSGLSDGSTVTVGSNSFTINYTSTDVTLTASAIPEPSTYAALAGVGALGAVALRRRRRQA
ncbi:MAG TPA: PEP-CTERM sorting domain-containing protein, partial [Roseimicrobium sp.]|nr:PEP-CTERM sorting domain-containing protein [Roseimicrobium sp.]